MEYFIAIVQNLRKRCLTIYRPIFFPPLVVLSEDVHSNITFVLSKDGERHIAVLFSFPLEKLLGSETKTSKI